jgi:hypothetical protein
MRFLLLVQHAILNQPILRYSVSIFLPYLSNCQIKQNFLSDISDAISCSSTPIAIMVLDFRSHQFLRQRANVSLSQIVEVKNWADVGWAGQGLRISAAAGVSAKLRPSYFGLSAESVEYKSSQRRGLFVNHPGA